MPGLTTMPAAAARERRPRGTSELTRAGKAEESRTRVVAAEREVKDMIRNETKGARRWIGHAVPLLYSVSYPVSCLLFHPHRYRNRRRSAFSQKSSLQKLNFLLYNLPEFCFTFPRQTH